MVKIVLAHLWTREGAQSIALIITEIKLYLLEAGTGLTAGLAS